MRKMYQSFVPAIIVLLALVMSAFWIMPVHADDGTPPSTAPAVTQPQGGSSTTDQSTTKATTDSSPAPSGGDAPVVNPPSTAPTVSQPQGGSTTTDASPAPSNGNAPVVNPPATDQPAPAITTKPVVHQATPAGKVKPAAGNAGLLAQVPSGTQVVVTNSSGDVVPLGSQEAAQTIATGDDPTWCPTGVNPGGAGCSSAGSFSALLASMTNKTVAGTIWIESTVTDTSPITLNSTTMGTSTVNYALTLKGGWNGSSGALAAITGSSTFSVPLTITWNSDVTLSNITITGLTDPTSTALTITTPKSVTLTGVNVNTNSGSGAKIDNTSSTTASAVTVSSSTFSNNTGGDGLDIFSKGAITLNGITASSNGDYGADLDNCIANGGSVCANVTPMAVTLTGTNAFNSNNGDGLDIYSKGAITLNGLTANSNTGYGALVENDYTGTTAGITLTTSSSNQFESNGYDGLDVYSQGAVTLNSITAYFNGLTSGTAYGYGVYVRNDFNTALPQAVSILGTNQFNSNNLDGLDVYSYGAITLVNATASGNGYLTDQGVGTYLDNCLYNSTTKACTTVTPATVTLTTNTVTSTSVFNSNYGDGLDVYSKGAITLNNVKAASNKYNGAWLENDFTGTISGITVTATSLNQFNSNGNDGLDVYSKGAIALTNVYAIGNSNDGTYLNNTTGTIASGVTLTGFNAFSENGSYGLEVHTNGAITASNLANNSNVKYGALLDNCKYNGTSCTTSTIAAVTLGGSNQFKFDSIGLAIHTNGAITLNNITANNNSSGAGVMLDNCGYNGTSCSSSIASAVTLTGINLFNENNSAGLLVYTNGYVLAYNLSATKNGYGDSTSGYGVDLQNYTAALAQPVIIYGTNFMSGNNLTNLYVNTKGAITIYNITSNSSQTGYGASLNNQLYGSLAVPQGVAVLGYATFNNNDLTGLNIASWGAISLVNVTANNNGQSKTSGGGVDLDNCNYNGTGCNAKLTTAVTLTGNNAFNNNYTYGLTVNSLGAIAVSNVNANGNGTNGAWLENDYTNAIGGVSITNTPAYFPSFNNNGSSGNYNGLNILSRGAITIWDVDASGNTGDGIFLNNTANTAGTAGVSFGTARVNWSNQLYKNYNNGLEVDSNGPVTLYNLDAETNGHYNSGTTTSSGYGVWINNLASSLSQGIALYGTNNFKNNYLSGIEIRSKGAVILYNIEADKNGYYTAGETNVYGYGIKVDNSSATANLLKGVTILGYANFNNNYDAGLSITSLGAISITNLNSNYNGVGAVLDNHSGNPGVGITFAGSANTSNNTGQGMDVFSRGLIYFNATSAYIGYNGAYGWNLNNDYTGAVGGITMSIAANQNFDFDTNVQYGLSAQSLGAITTSNLDAYNNGRYGVTLDNAYSNAATTATLTMNNLSTWDNNFNNNGDDGLDVLSNRLITLTSITAQNNGQNHTSTGYGAYIDNCGYNSTLNTCTSTITPASGITLIGTNYFNNNTHYGLWVTSKGAITASNLTALQNGMDGAFLDNQWGTGSLGGITLSGTNNFESNGMLGLETYSNGAITMNNVTSSWNTTGGASLGTHGLSTPQAVVLNGSNFFLDNSNNSSDGLENGLYITADGSITINSLMASWNDGTGANLNTSAGTITLTGTNSFADNAKDGLDTAAHGNITLNNITADNNGGTGVNGSSTNGSILVACGSMTNNKSYGWSFQTGTGQTVTLHGVFAYGNKVGDTHLTGGTLIYVNSCP